MARVLITRPASDAGPLIDWLRTHGHQPVLAPMLVIRPHTQPPDGLADAVARCAAILATSANGIRALARLTSRRDVMVLSVGPGTAAQAQALGFTSVISAQGDVVALAALVRQNLSPATGPLLHPAGSVLAGDLAALLGADGYVVRRFVLYEAIPAQSLPEALIHDLCTNGVHIATFFSPRTARSFVPLANAHGLAAVLTQCHALVVSQAVAEALAGLKWRSVQVTALPEQASLLTALKDMLAGLG